MIQMLAMCHETTTLHEHITSKMELERTTFRPLKIQSFYRVRREASKLAAILLAVLIRPDRNGIQAGLSQDPKPTLLRLNIHITL